MGKRFYLKRELFSDLIKERILELEHMLKIKAFALENASDGCLRCSRRSKSVQYYLISSKGDSNGKYIRKRDLKIARNIAQRDYDLKLVEKIKKQLALLRKTVAECGQDSVEKLFNSLKEERKRLVEPAFIPDERFVKEWKEVEYAGKGFYEDGPAFYTDNGERVRSKSEVLIGNLLKRYGIPYRYEYPVELNTGRTVYPDFFCLNVRTRKEFIWEHFGMMQDGEYAALMQKKLESYWLNGWIPGENLIMSFESDDIKFNQKIAEKAIQHLLM